SYDVRWLTPQSTEMTAQDWAFPEGHFLSYVLGPLDADGAPLFIVLNAAEKAIEFVLPAWSGCVRWSCALVTVAFGQGSDGAGYQLGAPCEAPPRSVSAFVGAACLRRLASG